MHRGTFLIMGLASALVLSADVQARPHVSTDAAADVNFSAYKTYSWTNANVTAGVNPVMQQQILAQIDAALAGLGYQKAADPADLSMVLTIGARQKTDVQSWGRFGLQTSIYQYTQGQLSLDVFDTKTQQALWHGQVTETVNPDKPNQAKVDAAIAQLMKQFPATAAVAPASPAPTP